MMHCGEMTIPCQGLCWKAYDQGVETIRVEMRWNAAFRSTELLREPQDEEIVRDMTHPTMHIYIIHQNHT